MDFTFSMEPEIMLVIPAKGKPGFSFEYRSSYLNINARLATGERNWCWEYEYDDEDDDGCMNSGTHQEQGWIVMDQSSRWFLSYSDMNSERGVSRHDVSLLKLVMF